MREHFLPTYTVAGLILLHTPVAGASGPSAGFAPSRTRQVFIRSVLLTASVRC